MALEIAFFEKNFSIDNMVPKRKLMVSKIRKYPNFTCFRFNYHKFCVLPLFRVIFRKNFPIDNMVLKRKLMVSKARKYANLHFWLDKNFHKLCFQPNILVYPTE